MSKIITSVNWSATGLPSGLSLDAGTGTISGTPTTEGEYDVPVTVTTNYGTDTKNIKVNVEAGGPFWGVEWDGTGTTRWTRTGLAKDFSDPVPYVAGASNYGSPFDSIGPWAGMVRSTDADAGELVAIPKFYYDLAKNSDGGDGLEIKISDQNLPGFHVSPAHMDRGDGKGERSTVYIGRYHCATSTYKSTSGVKPAANATRAAFRTSIHNLGANIWQCDFATRFTLWLLYLVEFADWNSQAKIGYGCGNNSSTGNMGYTDSMPYHTGTTLADKTTYGLGTQYRNIEGLWDNVFDWLDGCYNTSNGLNVILNPSNFSDSAGGVSIGKPSDGYPSAFGVSSLAGFPMFYPTAASGGSSKYSCDNWSFNASNPCVCGGGAYGPGTYHGLFCVGDGSATLSSADRGSRILKLP